MKRSKFSPKKRYPIILITGVFFLILLVSGALLVGINKTEQTLTKNSATSYTGIGKVLQSYFGKKSQNVWFIASKDIKVENADKFETIIDSFRSDILKVLEKYKDIPEVQEIRSKFGDRVCVSIYFQDGKRFLANKDYCQNSGERNDAIEVMLYTLDRRNDPYLGGAIFGYVQQRQGTSMIVLAAVQTTEIWFEGVIIHELEHALIAKEGRGFPDDTDEEIYCQRLQRKVLDQATKGEYLKVILDIVQRKKDIDTLNDFLNSITLEDMTRIDRIFGNSNWAESRGRMVQFLFDLSDLWIQQRFPEKDWLQQSRSAYREISNY